MACRYDIDCSMVSANSCDNETAGYQLCGQFPEMIASDEACTYRKIGILITFTFYCSFLWYIYTGLDFLFIGGVLFISTRSMVDLAGVEYLLYVMQGCF